MLHLLEASGEKKVKLIVPHRIKPLFLCGKEDGGIEMYDYEKSTCTAAFLPSSSYSSVHGLLWVDRSTLRSVNVNRPNAPERVLAVVDTGLLRLTLPCIDPATDIQFVPLSSLDSPPSSRLCALPVSDVIFAVGGTGDSSVKFFDFNSKKVCQRLNAGHRHHHRPSVMGGGAHSKESGHGSVMGIVSVEPYLPTSASSRSSFDAAVRSQILVAYDTGSAFLYSLEVTGNIIPPNSSPVNRIDNLEKGSPRVGYCAARDLIFATLNERQSIGIFQNTSADCAAQFGRSPLPLPLLQKISLPNNSLSGIILSRDPSTPSMTVMSTTKLSSTIAYSTPTNPNAHTIDVQPSLPFTFRKSKDNQTPKQLKIYEVSSTADPNTILLGTNHGVMALTTPFANLSYSATAQISPSTFLHVNEMGLIQSCDMSSQSKESEHDNADVVLRVPFQAPNGLFPRPHLVLSPSKSYVAIKQATSLFIMHVPTNKIIHTETTSIADFAWVGFTDQFAVSEKSRPKQKQDSESASSKRRSIFLSSKVKKENDDDHKVHHEQSKVLLKSILGPTNEVKDLGEVNTRGVASRMIGGPILNVTTTMQNSQFYSFVKDRGGGEPVLKAVGSTLPAPTSIAWSETTAYFAFLLETTLFVYRTSPLELIACSKVDTTNQFDDSRVVSMKFIEDTLFVSTTDSVMCCFISEGTLDVWTLASSSFTLVGTEGMSKIAAEKGEYKSKDGPQIQFLPFPSPEIVGARGTNLILWNCLAGERFMLSLDNKMLKTALFTAASTPNI